MSARACVPHSRDRGMAGKSISSAKFGAGNVSGKAQKYKFIFIFILKMEYSNAKFCVYYEYPYTESEGKEIDIDR